MILSKCQRCGKEKTYKYKSWVKPFCSHACANIGKVTGEKVTIRCNKCGSDFEILDSVKRAREKKGNVIKYCSPRCSAAASKKSKMVHCKNCGKEFETTRNKFCSRECTNDHRKKSGIVKRNGYWFENGYKVLYTPDGKGIKEHIKIMQDHIGRVLNHNEVVHHINENKLDNSLENLQLMTRGEHSKLHRKLDLERGKELFGR